MGIFTFSPLTCFYRTPLSWVKLFVFYVCFFAGLICFSSALYFVVATMLPPTDEGPLFQAGQSFLGNNPGLAIRPYRKMQKEGSNMQHYGLLINSSHLLEYDHQITGEKPAKEEKEWGPVEFAESLEYFRQSDAPLVTSTDGECGSFPFGFFGDRVRPCFYFKINNIHGWNPKAITKEDFKRDGGWSKELQNHWENQSDKNFIWLNCEQKGMDSKQNVSLKYFPATRGFPIKSFSKGSPRPIVAVQVDPRIEPTNVKNDVTIKIECKIYHKDANFELNASSKQFVIVFHGDFPSETVGRSSHSVDRNTYYRNSYLNELLSSI
jgi:hypothetical protein